MDYNHAQSLLEDYIARYTDNEDPVLKNLYRYTNLNTAQPHMISGHVQGRFLSMISKIINPSVIIEVGTFTGYSAICLSEGLAPNGHLYTYEINEEIAISAREQIEIAGKSDKITIYTGEASQLIELFPGTIDLSFIDGDKSLYIDYYEAILNKTRPGGIILADNVLWHEEWNPEKIRNDKSSTGIRKFNQKIQSDNRVEKCILPLRDGIFMLRKK